MASPNLSPPVPLGFTWRRFKDRAVRAWWFPWLLAALVSGACTLLGNLHAGRSPALGQQTSGPSEPRLLHYLPNAAESTLGQSGSLDGAAPPSNLTIPAAVPGTGQRQENDFPLGDIELASDTAPVDPSTAVHPAPADAEAAPAGKEPSAAPRSGQRSQEPALQAAAKNSVALRTRHQRRGASSAAELPVLQLPEGQAPVDQPPAEGLDRLRRVQPGEGQPPLLPQPPVGEPPIPRPQAALPEEIIRNLRPLRQTDTQIQVIGEQPVEEFTRRRLAEYGTVAHGPGTNRMWGSMALAWEASSYCHGPLYFEEINLERYGYSFGIAQPVVSMAHFFGRLPALPYLMTVDKPTECDYTLGYFRPGCPAPYRLHIPPLVRPDAAAVEGGVITGLIFLIP
jgi:hypothetical protein